MEKVKITKKELDDIYEIIPDIEDKIDKDEEDSNVVLEFEEYTEKEDKKMVDIEL